MGRKLGQGLEDEVPDGLPRKGPEGLGIQPNPVELQGILLVRRLEGQEGPGGDPSSLKELQADDLNAAGNARWQDLDHGSSHMGNRDRFS
jgi:hypothetical protein